MSFRLATAIFCFSVWVGCQDSKNAKVDAGANGDRDASAAVDAAVPDAAVPDAAVPDAAVPDATVPDAEIVDAEIADAEIVDAEIADAEVGGDCNTPAPQGAANFLEHNIDTALTHGQQLQLVDIDKDGDLDVVVPYSLTDSVHLYLNLCNSWQRVVVAPPNTLIATGVATGDFDSDGDIDIVAVAPYRRDPDGALGSVRWYENSGTPEAAWVEHNLGEFDGPRTVRVADLSGDDLPDIVIGSANYGPGVRWLRNTGTGFTGALPVSIPGADDLTNINAIVVHDVDNDGALDVIAAGTTDSNEIVWYQSGRGPAPADTIVFSKHIIESVQGPWGLALGNFDGDPAMELVASNNRGIEIYDPSPDPTGVWTTTSVTTTFAGDSSVYMVTADLDGDSTLDIAAVSGSSNAANAYLSNNNGSFTEKNIVVSYIGFNYIASGDMDGDGDTDIVTSTFDHASDDQGSIDTISWWENRP